jgi:DNA-binding NarL/FixJ family response regulator
MIWFVRFFFLEGLQEIIGFPIISKKMIKVLIVDDVASYRDSLSINIQKDGDIKVVGCASNGIEAIEKCRSILPDIVLMDIRMPVCDGIEGTKLIKAYNGNIKVLILSVYKDDENIVKALENGADGYLLKGNEPECIISTIKNTIQGLNTFGPSIFESLKKKFNLNKEQDAHD